jgi:hypothetical protein
MDENTFDQKSNERAWSIWHCPTCEYQVELRFTDLEEIGTPICSDCEEDMDLINVVIDPE